MMRIIHFSCPIIDFLNYYYYFLNRNRKNGQYIAKKKRCRINHWTSIDKPAYNILTVCE